MNKKILSSRGISLISLTITVIITLIITGTIIYNVKDNIKVEKLERMQQDIENLRDKVDTYYAQYGKIPAKFEAEYTNINKITDSGVISQAVDIGNFYVIDLQVIENLTLSFGQDYENVKTLTDSEQISAYTNLYIINEASHNIFYAEGIEVDGEKFYTNYTAEDIDTEAVKLHYVDNVKIPDGYNYVSGTKQTGIIIEDEETARQYKWIVLETEITELPEGVIVEDEVEFLNSANLYEGYYQEVEDETKVIYLTIEENWSAVYDDNGKYVDKNKDTAIIPAGFKVSRTPGMDTIYDGLVIQDEEGNEFVWVPVTEENPFKIRAGYNNGSLQDISNYGEADSTGTNSKITESETTQAEAKAMYLSVATNGGFYIGRYETGTTAITGDGIRGEAVIKKGANIYNYIGWNKDITNYDITVETGGAVEVARNFASNKGYDTTKVHSTLCYGVQWDTALNFIDPGYKGYAKNSAKMGWYSDNHNTTSTGNNETNPNHIAGKDLIYNSEVTVSGSGETAVKIPAGEPTNMHKNIYDMAGNVYEWTMESCNTNFRASRGGYYYNTGSSFPASNRLFNYPTFSSSDIGFRVALYL